MTIDELIENFQLFDDWEDRYKYIIELGKKLPELPEKYKTDSNKVQGCVSQVWLVINETPQKQDEIEFLADSDAFIVKGLVAILMIIYNHKSKKEIADINIEEIFTKLKLEGHISPSRRNGFFSMVQRIQSLSHQV
ncbi:MAG: SufE family protein [Bdellovibrionales bacterium]|nr:SufE family protein [Bdellovibrionales bacterium]